jgi:GNAT superfamily N-acetyltransferase
MVPDMRNASDALPSWRAMTAEDLVAVTALSLRIHPAYPERGDVLAEKFNLFPQGCYVLTDGPAILGYCFSHPWSDGAPPALDTFLATLPVESRTYFIHDLTLDRPMQGQKLAQRLVPVLVETARKAGLSRMALVAVNGSAPFWGRMGFRPTPDEAVQQSARSKYDAGAVHMQRSPV